MLRDSISRGLVVICAGVLIGGCDQTTAPDPGQDPAATEQLLVTHGDDPKATLLVSGLQGSLGSTIGPDGALYVAEGAAGRISRIDPQSGATTTFASGLPLRVVPPEGGVMDVAFIGTTAYALVSLVGSDVGGTEVVGIYRVDGPESFTVVADIGAFNLANPPTKDFVIEAPTGYQLALQPYRGGFLVSDGHLNRVLRVTSDGEIRVVIAFGNIVPTGLAVSDNTVYLAQAGPLPHRRRDGKIVSFTLKSPTARKVASGARLLVDVEFGPGRGLYALSQGEWVGTVPGTPAQPNTGSLVRVKEDGTFALIVKGLNQPTSLEFIGNTAYVVTLGGEIWKIEDVPKH